MEIKGEVKEFHKTVEKERRKELRDINASLCFITQVYVEVISELNEIKSEKKEFYVKNAKLHTHRKQLSSKLTANE